MASITDCITSFIDGRVRLRHFALKDASVAETVCAVVGGVEGVESVQANPVTGSLLIFYDTEKLSRQELDELWRQFGDVPMNLYTERIESPFLEWKAGTAREEIWRWFDQRYSKGVAYLMYGEAEDFVAESKQLYRLKKMCDECESNTCQFNHDGECRFALVHERKPDIVPDDGCRDYQFREV